MLSRSALQKLEERFPALQALSPASRERIAQEATYARIAAGCVLFEAGAPCASFPLLLSGQMQIVQAAENGREMTLYRLNSGDMCVVSASCLFGAVLYQVSGIAVTDMEIVSFSSELFPALVAQEEAFRTFVFRLFTERLHGVMVLIEAVAFQRLDRRLAALLLTKGSTIHQTHQSLAEELGSVREMVSRLLRRFEEQGAVTLGRERITLVNPAILQKIAAH